MQSLFGSGAETNPVLRALDAAEVATSAGPWRMLASRRVGGLTALGFDRASEDMLVTSTSGQSVIDGRSGDLIYRNHDQDGLDPAALKGTRLDHPADARFDMAGLYGGGLRTCTNDGWSVERIGAHAVLHPPSASIRYLGPEWDSYRKDATFHVLDRSTDDPRVIGFSWSGQTLVSATAQTLVIWGRPPPLAL